MKQLILLIITLFIISNNASIFQDSAGVIEHLWHYY